MSTQHTFNLPEGLPPICFALHEAKTKKQLSFEQIAKEIGRGEVFVAALFYGQAKPEKEDITKLSKVLNIPEDHLTAQLGEHFYPSKGSLGHGPPTDPTLYRLHEIMLVYGQPFKSLINEKFGDGIMSAIDFTADVQKKEDPKGDRVVITLDGKFLPYKRW